MINVIGLVITIPARQDANCDLQATALKSLENVIEVEILGFYLPDREWRLTVYRNDLQTLEQEIDKVLASLPVGDFSEGSEIIENECRTVMARLHEQGRTPVRIGIAAAERGREAE